MLSHRKPGYLSSICNSLFWLSYNILYHPQSPISLSLPLALIRSIRAEVNQVKKGCLVSQSCSRVWCWCTVRLSAVQSSMTDLGGVWLVILALWFCCIHTPVSKPMPRRAMPWEQLIVTHLLLHLEEPWNGWKQESAFQGGSASNGFSEGAGKES